MFSTFLSIYLFFFFFFFSFSSTSSIKAHPISPPFSWAETESLLAFGDSYTYVQGLFGRQNYSFIGDAFNFSYAPSQLLSDTIIQNQIGTSAGGPNWVEYLTGCFEGLPNQCQGDGKKELWDFAFAGADVSTSYLTLHHNYSVDLNSQIRQYDTYARPYLTLKPDKTVVAIFIGINDISDSAKWTNVSFPNLYNSIIAAMLESVSTIATGSNLHDFLFMNLPPLEKTPGNVVAAAQNKTVYPSAVQVASWNSILSAKVGSWSISHDAVRNAWVFDTYDFLNRVIEQPATYRLSNVTHYCPRYDAPDIAINYAAYGCLPIDQYFWYNTGHVTYRVHEILAQEVARFLDWQSRGVQRQRAKYREFGRGSASVDK